MKSCTELNFAQDGVNIFYINFIIYLLNKKLYEQISWFQSDLLQILFFNYSNNIYLHPFLLLRLTKPTRNFTPKKNLNWFINKVLLTFQLYAHPTFHQRKFAIILPVCQIIWKYLGPLSLGHSQNFHGIPIISNVHITVHFRILPLHHFAKHWHP